MSADSSPDSELRDEIRRLLATHAGEPVDYVAIFMLLNTVAGGHYQERHTETAIRTALAAELQAGGIVAFRASGSDPGRRIENVEPGVTECIFRLRA